MRIKCLILAVFLLFSCIAVNATAETTADLIQEKHISLLSQLGINEGINKASDEIVTRAEFTAMVVRAINANSISVSEEYFTDCADGLFKREVYIAKAMGITNGTTETTFSPNEGVTVAVAAKMLVNALGYGDLAEAKGGYPTGYLTLAQSINIFDGIAQGEMLTIKDAYTLIYNTMITETPIITGVNGENFVIETVENRTLLTEKFHLTHINGIVMSAGGYSLVSELAEKGKICVSGTMLNTDTDLKKYFGLDVDIWYDDSKTVKIILETYSNTIVTVGADDISNYSNNVLSTFNEKNKEVKYNLEPGFSFVQNGRVVPHTNESFTFDEGKLTLIDNDGNNKYDIVLAQKPKYFVISSLNNATKTIYDKYSDYGSISFEDDINKFCYIEIDGEQADFSLLTKDMVCEIYMSTDLGVCLLKASKNPPVDGVLDEIQDNDMVIVSGTTYKLNSYFKNSSIDLKPGTAYTFLIAPDSTITSITKSTDSEIQYAYMLGYGRQTGLASKPQIKLLTTDNTVCVFELDSNIYFNGKKIKNSDEEISDILLIDGNIPRYQLVRFRSVDGVVDMLDTPNASSLENWSKRLIVNDYNSLTKYVSKKDVRYSEHSSFGIPNVSFDRAVTFFIPKSFENGQKYSDDLFICTGHNNYLRSAGIYSVDAYDYDANYCPGAVVVYYTDGNTTNLQSNISSHSDSYVVRDINDAVDNDGNVIKLLKVYGDGLYKEYPMEIDTYNALLQEQESTQVKSIPTRGDIVRVSTNTKGFINGIAVDGVYDSVNNSVSISYGSKGVYSTGNELLTYFSGNVLSLEGGYMLMNALSAPSDSVWDDRVVNLKMGSSLKYVVYNNKSGLVRAGTEQDIVAGLDKDDPNASFVVVRTQYFNGQTIFIYEN